MTGSGAPAAGFVYKLVEVEGRAVAKRSEDKSTRGGRKTAVRRHRSTGTATEGSAVPFHGASVRAATAGHVLGPRVPAGPTSSNGGAAGPDAGATTTSHPPIAVVTARVSAGRDRSHAFTSSWIKSDVRPPLE